jgi:hypothetical protein
MIWSIVIRPQRRLDFVRKLAFLHHGEKGPGSASARFTVALRL